MDLTVNSAALNRIWENGTLPSGLLMLTCGDEFSQSLEEVILPSGLRSLTFGYRFDQPLEKVTLPSSLQDLTFGFSLTKAWRRYPCRVAFRL